MKLIIKVIMLGALFIMLSPSNSYNASAWLNMDDEPVSFVYSSDLVEGFNATWTVTESTFFNGSDVTDRNDVLYGYLEGDELTVEIIGNVSEYNLVDLFAVESDFFDFQINGGAGYWNDMFILPIEATWENGTTGNFIELYYIVEEGFGVTSSSVVIEGGEIIMKVDIEETTEFLGITFDFIYHQEIRYETTTGVLNYFYYEANLFDQIIEIVKQGYDTPSGGSDDDVPFASIWFIAASMLAIPVIIRLRRKD
jgi:hypothetical protein